MRFLAGNGTIIDYYKLTAAELSETIDFIGAQMPEKKELLIAALQGVAVLQSQTKSNFTMPLRRWSQTF